MDRRSCACTLDSEFVAQVAKSPGAIAVSQRGASITFASLNERADRLAALLRCRGAADGFVGVYAERSIDYVVAVLGVLKANSAVVPLPASYPRNRLRHILEFAGLSAIVDVEATRLDIPVRVRVIHLADASSVPAEPDSRTTNDSARPAFVLSSSGSTSHPKLIVRSHGSFFHRLRWTWEQHPVEAGEVCVQKSHMTTTHAIYELFEPMLRGATVHIVSDDEVLDLPAFWHDLARLKVSRLLIVPSMLQASLDIPGLVLPPLKVLVLMGERVSPSLAARALAAFPESTSIVSIYGSTEASSALVTDVRASYRPDAELPLGAPISPDVCALVLDEGLQPVRDGEAGMLYLGGPQLFAEYHRDQVLTSTVRITRDDRVLYRTQDRVRMLAGGGMEFLGRADDMVKVRGFRVDTREVERAIGQHAEVQRCVVVAGSNRAAGGSSSLVAFVTPATVDSRRVLDAARDRLPSYMVPSAVVSLDAFPLTSSGKVDSRRLFDEFQAAPAGANRTLESETERRIDRVWSDVLGHHRFNRDSSFFDVGGTSLDVFAVAQRLAEALSLDAAALKPMVFYEHPTLAELASYSDRVRRADAPTDSGADTILVTLKRGIDKSLAPLFLISSAGGTPGAYGKLVRALGAEREIVGVRDPFLWGARDPLRGFQAWVTQYVDAIRERQSHGPYFIAAYSSAGALAYEIARRLRGTKEDVALLALIDPLALDRGSRRRYGYWALEARFGRPVMTAALRLAGGVRRAVPRARLEAANSQDWTLSNDEFHRFENEVNNDKEHLRRLSALLELNTGLPFSLSEAEIAAAGENAGVEVLLKKIRAVAPDVDLDMMRRLVVQYELQVRSQHNYQLRPYDGAVNLFEPDGPHVGLEAAQLRPYVRRLRTRSLPVGRRAAESSVLDGAFPGSILTHYLCMRDDTFVAQLARELDALLPTA